MDPLVPILFQTIVSQESRISSQIPKRQHFMQELLPVTAGKKRSKRAQGRRKVLYQVPENKIDN
jgi:hypothetical protein